MFPALVSAAEHTAKIGAARRETGAHRLKSATRHRYQGEPRARRCLVETGGYLQPMGEFVLRKIAPVAALASHHDYLLPVAPPQHDAVTVARQQDRQRRSPGTGPENCDVMLQHA
jgi:hypothetical protein